MEVINNAKHLFYLLKGENMKPDNNAWLTLFDSLFKEKEYLYHFTTIHNVQKILDSNSLKFSKINRSNDTLESKPKLSKSSFADTQDYSNLMTKLEFVNNNVVQLLCFSMDHAKQPQSKDFFKKYADYSGRGFALPRMWAQYASNNTGVCLVFKKAKLIELIKNQLGSNLILNREVDYCSQFKKGEFDSNSLNRMIRFVNLSCNSNAEQYSIREFLVENIDFTQYNYFTKLNDWENEKEYRFLALGADDIYINNISEALSGVVVGERIEPYDLKVIKLFCASVCEIKKITFTYKNCQLENIHTNEVEL